MFPNQWDWDSLDFMRKNVALQIINTSISFCWELTSRVSQLHKEIWHPHPSSTLGPTSRYVRLFGVFFDLQQLRRLWIRVERDTQSTGSSLAFGWLSFPCHPDDEVLMGHSETSESESADARVQPPVAKKSRRTLSCLSCQKRKVKVRYTAAFQLKKDEVMLTTRTVRPSEAMPSMLYSRCTCWMWIRHQEAWPRVYRAVGSHRRTSGQGRKAWAEARWSRRGDVATNQHSKEWLLLRDKRVKSSTGAPGYSQNSEFRRMFHERTAEAELRWLLCSRRLQRRQA